MHQVDPSVPVVVLGVHHGTLGIARSLGRLGIAGSCGAGDRSHPALASRYLRRVVAWDMKRAPEAATVAFLEELAHRLGGRPLLIPTTDATTLFVAQHAAPLAASFRFPRRSCELVRSEEHTSELQSLTNLVCRLLLEKKTPARYPGSILHRQHVDAYAP